MFVWNLQNNLLPKFTSNTRTPFASRDLDAPISNGSISSGAPVEILVSDIVLAVAILGPIDVPTN